MHAPRAVEEVGRGVLVDARTPRRSPRPARAIARSKPLSVISVPQQSNVTAVMRSRRHQPHPEHEKIARIATMPMNSVATENTSSVRRGSSPRSGNTASVMIAKRKP